MPGLAQRVPGGLGSQISWHSAREGGDVVSFTQRPPLPPGMFVVLIFIRGWVDPRAAVWSEGNMSLKNPVTPPGINTGTVRLVAQRLNHYATPGPNKQHSLSNSTHKKQLLNVHKGNKVYFTTSENVFKIHAKLLLNQWLTHIHKNGTMSCDEHSI